MPDTFTTTSSEGWFSRIKNAIIGVFVGMLFVPGSIALMGWNEYRTIHRTRGLNEGEKVVQIVENPDRVDSSLDRQLVHLTGQATTEEVLSDQDFALELPAIKLRRFVEMFQWVEHKETENKKKLGGGRTKKTTYRYEKEWASGRENSEDFKQQGHDNPRPHFDSDSKTAKLVNLGGYQLNDRLVGSINSYEDVAWDDQWLDRLPQDLKDQSLIEGEFLYWSAAGTQGQTNPSLGDQRIKFEVVRPTAVSLIAQQTGNTFSPFKTSNGESLEDLYVGTFTAAEIFEKLRSANSMWAWILRGLGFVVCGIGFSMILGPISVVADVIPFLGSLTRSGLGLISFLLAIVVSAMTISFAWIAVRPLIGVPLALLAIAAVVAIFRYGRQNQINHPPAAPEPPRPFDQVELVE